MRCPWSALPCPPALACFPPRAATSRSSRAAMREWRLLCRQPQQRGWGLDLGFPFGKASSANSSLRLSAASCFFNPPGISATENGAQSPNGTPHEGEVEKERVGTVSEVASHCRKLGSFMAHAKLSRAVLPEHALRWALPPSTPPVIPEAELRPEPRRKPRAFAATACKELGRRRA